MGPVKLNVPLPRSTTSLLSHVDIAEFICAAVEPAGILACIVVTLGIPPSTPAVCQYPILFAGRKSGDVAEQIE
jgi:hypothetical protein